MYLINPYRFKNGSSSTTLKDGLISVWEFNEASGSTVYDSHGSNNSTNYGATINQTGNLDKSYSFDGSTSYCLAPHNNNLSFNSDQIVSFSSWFYFDSNPSGYNRIVSKKFEYEFFCYDGQGQLRLYDNGTSTYYYTKNSSNIIQSGWWHLVITFDGTYATNSIKIYLNNVLQSVHQTPSTTYQMINTGNDLYFGKSDAYSGVFGGLIDQTAIWNKVLTIDEIALLYNNGSGLEYSSW